MNLVKLFTVLLLAPFFWACTDPNDEGGFAGGTTEDAGIVAELNVAGLTQKGPFAKGSPVMVQGVDCKTMQLTNQKFEGSVESDKGDFAVKNVRLSSTCALFEVSGYYLSEISGKRTTDKLALRALTDLKDRKNVNVNLLTHLEYARVMYLVTEKKMAFADAKKQAEQEVLAAFEIEGKFEEFENLNIFEAGDGNAALFAVSVLMQGGTDVAGLLKRVDKFDDSFAESGVWTDSSTKAAITDWTSSATASGKLDSIRKNVEEWGYATEIPKFEKYVEKFAIEPPVELPNVMTDTRDGQVYRIVKIGNQVWMAENLNYAYMQPTRGIDSSSFCYNDSAENCAKYGRLYIWSAAMDSAGLFSTGTKGCGFGSACARTNIVQGVCPTGWHLPTQAEWDTLFASVGGKDIAGKLLKVTTGWKMDSLQTSSSNDSDAFGFSMLPAGGRLATNVYSGILEQTNFWSSTECNSVDCGTLLPVRFGAYYVGFGLANDATYISTTEKDFGYSVRCVMDDPNVSAEVVPAFVDYFPPCKTDGIDTCKYGTLTDERDGQTYKTVKIGELEWMAENLNYAYLQPTSDLDSSSFCYNDSAEYCAKYGRLYMWSAAMDSVSQFSTDGAGCGYGDMCWPATSVVRGVCPEGWHLPHGTEWYYLFDGIYGVYSIAMDREWPTVGKGLKTTTGWTNDGNGSDAYGFSVLPVGFRSYADGSYGSDGSYARFWGSGEYKTFADALSLGYDNDGAAFDATHTKNDAYSVRCVKNWKVGE